MWVQASKQAVDVAASCSRRRVCPSPVMHLFPEQRNADSYEGSPTDLALRGVPLHTRHRASDPDSPPLRPDLSSGFSGHSSYVKTGFFLFRCVI